MRAEDSRMAEVKAQRAKKKQAQAKNRAKANSSSRKGKSTAAQDSVRRLQMEIPPSANPGETCCVTVQFDLAEDLGEQQLQVTMKSAELAPQGKPSTGKRLHREVVAVKGNGHREIEFMVPSDLSCDAVSFAAFLGEDFETCVLHITSKSVPLNHAAVPVR